MVSGSGIHTCEHITSLWDRRSRLLLLLLSFATRLETITLTKSLSFSFSYNCLYSLFVLLRTTRRVQPSDRPLAPLS